MSFLPVGKLRAAALSSLFPAHPVKDPRVVVGPRVGEDAAVLDMGDRYLIATTDPITFASDDIAWYALCVNGNAGASVAGATTLTRAACSMATKPGGRDTLNNTLLLGRATRCGRGQPCDPMGLRSAEVERRLTQLRIVAEVWR